MSDNMTKFYKIVDNGYILGIGTNGNDTVTEISETEYLNLLSVIQSAPSAPEGFVYKLSAKNLEWEMVEMPEPIDENADISDYENALSDLGVRFDD